MKDNESVDYLALVINLNLPGATM